MEGYLHTACIVLSLRVIKDWTYKDETAMLPKTILTILSEVHEQIDEPEPVNSKTKSQLNFEEKFVRSTAESNDIKTETPLKYKLYLRHTK